MLTICIKLENSIILHSEAIPKEVEKCVLLDGSLLYIHRLACWIQREIFFLSSSQSDQPMCKWVFLSKWIVTMILKYEYILCEWKCYFDQILVGFGFSSYWVRRQLFHLIWGMAKAGRLSRTGRERMQEQERILLFVDSIRYSTLHCTKLYIFKTLGVFPVTYYYPIFQII